MTAAAIDRAGVRVTAKRVQTSAEDIARRFLQDAMTEALACQWRRKAEVFESARPRPSDYTGRATAADLAAQDARLANLARLCRAHARLIETSAGAELLAELDDLLNEGADRGW